MEHKPKCEMCKKSEAKYFAHSVSVEYSSLEWLFVCGRCANAGHIKYDFEMSRFFANKHSTIDWMAHLNEKNWFSPRAFFNMFKRLRAAGNYYGGA